MLNLQQQIMYRKTFHWYRHLIFLIYLYSKLHETENKAIIFLASVERFVVNKTKVHGQRIRPFNLGRYTYAKKDTILFVFNGDVTNSIT